MANQRFGISLSNGARAGAVAIGLVAASAAYAINPVFADKFSYCMEYWNAQERADTRVYPKGYEKTDFCMEWARENLPSIRIRPTELASNPDAERGGEGEG